MVALLPCRRAAGKLVVPLTITVALLVLSSTSPPAIATLASAPPELVPTTPAPAEKVHAPPDNPPPASVTGCDADAVVETASVPPVVRICSLLTRLRIDCVPAETRIVGLAATEI